MSQHLNDEAKYKILCNAKTIVIVGLSLMSISQAMKQHNILLKMAIILSLFIHEVGRFQAVKSIPHCPKLYNPSHTIIKNATSSIFLEKARHCLQCQMRFVRSNITTLMTRFFRLVFVYGCSQDSQAKKRGKRRKNAIFYMRKIAVLSSNIKGFLRLNSARFKKYQVNQFS